MLIEFCVHGHFYREEGNTNGVYGAWWAPLDLLIDKVGKEAMKMLCADFFLEGPDRRTRHSRRRLS